ncbi:MULTISPECIES: PPK2 family polyphosphate kinase [Derxia]|uniref:PPK2 family polyphosphate kinase n=1 Tax=Derxia gummosa DSM 723 TaxID=1121388 RepID=A0A8B6X8U1_9BURK|nr:MULTISPECIES: PPK2 family polyphosphate kinase [Derxia]
MTTKTKTPRPPFGQGKSPLKPWIADGDFRLRNFDPADRSLRGADKAAGLAKLDALSGRLDALQNLLYAGQKHRLLVLLQGMDTSGKDGTIRHVFAHVDPLGVRAVPFKAPTPPEAARDFLWRVHAQVPGGGETVIFNRSHYEDVLVPAVYGRIDTAEVERRLAHIRDFERMLVETGTTLVKCFLHISKDEQKARLRDRLDTPEKRWKFDPHDLVDRERWDDYQAAYERAIEATTTPWAPWLIVPADSKTNRNVMVATAIVEALESLDLQVPVNPAVKKGMKFD